MYDLMNDFHIAVPTAFYDNEDLNTRDDAAACHASVRSGCEIRPGMRHDRGAAQLVVGREIATAGKPGRGQFPAG